MLRGQLFGNATRHAYYQWHGKLATGHEGDLGSHVNDGIQCQQGKVDGHDLDHRSHIGQCGTDAQPGKTAFRYGRVAHAPAFMMPCPVQLFAHGELDDAKRWLSESLGSIQIDSEGDIVTARLLGKLDPSVYDGVNEEIDNIMSRAEHVRLVLDLREFDGWSGLSALGDHLSLVREHYRVPERIAIVGDKAWQKMAGKIMARFVNAQTKFFDSDDYDGAVAWVAA